MKIDYLTPDNEILSELGRRLSRVRKQKGYTQQQLATEAGIGVATLRRIEGGQDSQLESWLKLLKAMDMTLSIDNLLPENFDSPRATALAANKRRRRHKPAAPGILWGDESS